jgi:hypothetical protein
MRQLMVVEIDDQTGIVWVSNPDEPTVRRGARLSSRRLGERGALKLAIAEAVHGFLAHRPAAHDESPSSVV